MADDKKKGDKPAKQGPAKSAAPKAAAKPPKGKPAGEEAAAAPRTEGRPHAPASKPRLASFYAEKVRPALMQKFSYASAMQAPRFEKIVINMGVGEAVQDQKKMEAAVGDLTAISGQKPLVIRSRKAIANFKLREGVAVGCTVTLRGARMWEFYDRLINVAVPRIRDFRGLNPRSFDGRGNYTMGVTEQIIFPEINYDQIEKVKGLNISFVTSAGTDERGLALLKGFGMPFRQ